MIHVPPKEHIASAHTRTRCSGESLAQIVEIRLKIHTLSYDAVEIAKYQVHDNIPYDNLASTRIDECIEVGH